MRICFSRPASLRGLAGTLAALGLLASLPADSTAAGAWQTHIRTKDFTDLLVTDEAVYCATGEAGLVRFDRAARTFTSITREPGTIASNQLTSLAYDRVGRLWVGTVASGVSRLSADGTTWDLVNAFDGLPVDSVTTITVVGDTLWIGTRGGVALWDGRQVRGSLPDGNTVSFDTTFSNPSVTGVVQLGDTLWLSTRRGVGFARTSNDLSDWRKANAGLPTLTVDRLVTNGRFLYALAAGAIYRWEPISLEWTHTGLGGVFNLQADQGILLASTSSGIWRHPPDATGFVPIVDSPIADANPGNDMDAAVDPAGGRHYAGGLGIDADGRTTTGLWEEPLGGGPWTFHLTPGPAGNTYGNIIVQGSRVYAATRDEGIGRWDGSTWFNWPHVACQLPCPDTFKFPNEVFAMVVDRAGRKWVACWSYALERFDDSVDPHVFEHLWDGSDITHTWAHGAAMDSTGGLWFGMDSPVSAPTGLDYYDATGTYVGTWGPNSPPGVSEVRGGKIRAVTVDKTGRVWIGYAGTGSSSGVDHFVARPIVGNDFETVPNTVGLDIWGMVAHGDSIWVLTSTDLRRIQRSGPASRVVQTLATPALRAPDAPSHHLDVAPDGSVWVGVVSGVRWYRPGAPPQDFTVANSPLASNDVRAVAVEPGTGVVWFGTVAGLNRFDPGYRPPTPPPGIPDPLRVFPSPATLTGAGLQLRLEGTAAGYRGGIYDIRGRLVREFITTSRGQVFWDGRDRDGVLVRPGVYFLRADHEGRQARARFVLLH